MPAAPESVEDSEDQSESQLQSVRAPRWGLLPPFGQPPVERIGGSGGQDESQLAVSESAPLKAAASSWVASS